MRLRRCWRCLTAAASWSIALPPLTVAALDFELHPGVDLSIDTTLSQELIIRVQDRDPSIIGIANGGTADSVNHDDGTLNYDDGSIARNVSRFVTDFELDAGDLNAFMRVRGFMDWENELGSRARTPLSSEAKDLVGQALDVLDLYGAYSFNIADRVPGQVRLGRQVINWGESTFIPNGINVFNPVDVSKLRTPGSELKDALLAQPAIWGSISPTSAVTLEGYYQLDWDKTDLDPVGFYFSTNDFVPNGGTHAFLGFGEFSDLGTGFGPLTAPINADLAAGGQPLQPAFDSTFLGVPRAADKDPDNSGQWGVALRYFAEQLAGTEFGLYFVNYHSRLPYINALTGTDDGVAAGLAAAGLVSGAVGPGNTLAAVGPEAAAGLGGAIGIDRYAKTTKYIVDYPRNIFLLGASFSTEIGSTGWALQGEYSFRKDVPLQIDDVELLFAALTPLSAASPPGSPFQVYTRNQITRGGTVGTDTIIPGFIERNVSQFQATASKVLGPTLGADTGLFVVEVGVMHVHDMPDQEQLRLNAPGTDTSGDPFHSGPTGAHTGKPFEPSDKFPTATSWGYRLAANLQYNNAIGAVTLIPRVQFAHDANGISPQPIGPFLEGRMAVSVGVRAKYLESWEGDIGYTNFFGAGSQNFLNDRDFVNFTLRYSF